MRPRICRAPRRPLGRARRWLALEHDVVLEHVPTLVPGLAQRVEHLLDLRDTFTERTEESSAHRIVVTELAAADARPESAVYVLEMHVPHARAGVARDLQRIGPAECDVAGIE